MNACGASLQGEKLTLNGVATKLDYFCGPSSASAAGYALTSHLLEEWAESESFGKDPPNATVSVLSKGSSVKDAVIVLKSPKTRG